jgi:predicted ATPase/DNA-binding CsgD family transcriptional regulator
MNAYSGPPLTESLTERELDILRLISEGLSNREIAQELVLTPGTVKWYTKQIYSKLGVHSRTQAIAQAQALGLLDAERQAGTAVQPSPRLRHNLPAQLTSFVGRKREIAEVKQLLKTARLLTLTGTAGTGKTRLALQVAADVIGDFQDGVYFVDLAPISDPVLVAHTVANVLAVPESGDKPLASVLAHFLRARETLLVLDNFEHVLPAAPLVSDLLAAAPRLKVLVTSREVLHIYGEQVYTVPPLTLPDRQRSETLVELAHYESVALFSQRARAVNPEFVLNDDTASPVAEICVRLDGLPLALELAAARSRLLSPQAMLDRFSRRLDVLRGGARDLPDRQQTLRSAIDWSYDLLDAEERILFARLGVFQGGRTVEAIEIVCGHDLGIDVLDGLESLLNKSLIRQQEGPDGEPHFTMLETIHEYARERLEQSGEAEAMRRRHADYFVALVEQAEPELRGARQEYWSARLRAEHNNLRTALAWSLGGAETELGMRLAGALRDFWYNEGYFVEGWRWTERALEDAEDALPAVRAKIFYTAGFLSYYLGDLEGVKRWCSEALALYRELGDRVNSAWALIFLSSHHTLGNPTEVEEGIALCEEGLALFRQLDSRSGLNQALTVLGELSRAAGDYERAEIAYQEALALCREAGNRQREAINLGNLSYVAVHQGDYERAVALAREALALFWKLDKKYYTAFDLSVLAGPVAATGQLDRAARLLGASAALLETIGVGFQPADQFEIDRYVAAVRAQLDEAAFEAAWAAGRAMSLEEAVAFALDKPGAG